MEIVEELFTNNGRQTLKRTTLILLLVCGLVLASCQSPKQAVPTANLETPKAEVITDGPLSIEILETRLIEPDLKIPESANVEMTVRFTNLGEKRVAILRSDSLVLDVKNEAGIAPKPLVVVDQKMPTPLEIVQLGPEEGMTLRVFSGPFSLEDLGEKPKASLSATTWSLKQIAHDGQSIPKLDFWPKANFQSRPVPVSSRAHPYDKPKGRPTLEFLKVTTVRDDGWGGPGTRVWARYRVSNNGPTPILTLESYPLLHSFAADSKRNYPSFASRAELAMPTVWDLVIIHPGESKTTVASQPPYTEKEMEEIFDFRYEVHPWELARIEYLPKYRIPKDIKTFPPSVQKSPLYNLDRRH